MTRWADEKNAFFAQPPPCFPFHNRQKRALQSLRMSHLAEEPPKRTATSNRMHSWQRLLKAEMIRSGELFLAGFSGGRVGSMEEKFLFLP